MTPASELIAITRYAGIDFKSRHHARWAVFLTSLSLRWLYHPEVFDLPALDTEGTADVGNLRYLPHFHVPAQELFPKSTWFAIHAEISAPSVALSRFAFHRGERIGVLREIPWPRTVSHYEAGGQLLFSGVFDGPESDLFDSPGGDSGYTFTQCPFCNVFGFEFGGRSARVGCGCPQHKRISNGDKSPNDASPSILRAYSLARSADFESEAA